MPVFPPIPLIRKKIIINKLKQCGAVTPETAKTFAQAGIPNPDAFARITQKLVENATIYKTADGRFYLPK